MSYFSIRDAARKAGVTTRTLYRRPDIQEMLASTTPEIASKGLKLYPLSAFPSDIKIALMETTHPTLRAPLLGGDLPAQILPDPHKQLNPTAAEEVSARLEILNYRDTWSEAGNYPNQYEVDIAFCKAATAGELPDIQAQLDLLAWGQYQGLSRATLCRMRQKRKRQQIGELSRTVGHRKGTGAIDRHESLNRFILGQILTHPHQSIDQLYAKMQELTFPAMPSLPSVRRWVEHWIAEHQSEYLSVVNPDAWRNKYQVAYGSYSEGVSQPNQLWEIDSSPTDTMLTDGRSTEVALIDVYTRRVMVKIFKTSKSEAIMTLIRLAIIEWGIPTSIKSDRGTDYCSKAVVRFCAELAIELRHCQPYSPWQKPHVERFFGTLNHAQADLPGYIGHDVATREAIRSQHSFADNRRKPDLGAGDKGTISPAQFQSWLDDWVAKYNRQTHSETGKIPDQAFAELAHPERCRDAAKLNQLMSCAGDRKVGKKGIRWQSYEFYAAELTLHSGSSVRIYNDANDLSRLLVYDLAGLFICESVCFELRGISTYDIARAATAKQNANKAEFKRTAAKFKREATKLRPNVEAIHAAAQPPVAVELAPVLQLVKPAPIELVRSGDDIYLLLLTAYRLGNELPTDLTDKELYKLRRLRELQPKFCDKNLETAIADPNDRTQFIQLLDQLLEKSHVTKTRAC